MDVYGSDTAPDDEGAAGTSGTETTPEVGAWFQRARAGLPQRLLVPAAARLPAGALTGAGSRGR